MLFASCHHILFSACVHRHARMPTTASCRTGDVLYIFYGCGSSAEVTMSLWFVEIIIITVEMIGIRKVVLEGKVFREQMNMFDGLNNGN